MISIILRLLTSGNANHLTITHCSGTVLNLSFLLRFRLRASSVAYICEVLFKKTEGGGGGGNQLPYKIMDGG